MFLCSLHRRAHANARRLGESQGRLEVRGDGVRPAVLMDLHAGRAGRHCRNHPAGPDALRRPNTHRQEVLGLCLVYGRKVRCTGNQFNRECLPLVVGFLRKQLQVDANIFHKALKSEDESMQTLTLILLHF